MINWNIGGFEEQGDSAAEAVARRIQENMVRDQEEIVRVSCAMNAAIPGETEGIIFAALLASLMVKISKAPPKVQPGLKLAVRRAFLG